MHIARDFDASLFVAPKDACRWLQTRVKRWRESTPTRSADSRLWKSRRQAPQPAPGDRVLNLVGERGIGKSWFLHYLAHHDPLTSPLAVYLDLGGGAAVASVQDYVADVAARIQSRCGSGRAILLLDRVPSRLDETLRVLEDAVLRPYLVHRFSLVVMALVHPYQVCWRAPALRAGERYALRAFGEAQTQEQLRRLDKASLVTQALETAQVHRASGGLPLLNYLLATQNRAAAFALLLDYWLSGIPAQDRQRLQGYLMAVCLLDCLEHASIQRMLEVYHHFRPDAPGYPAHAGGVRNMLRKYWLARPAPDAPGRIVLADGVRHAIRQMLQSQDAVLFRALSEAAQRSGEEQT